MKKSLKREKRSRIKAIWNSNFKSEIKKRHLDLRWDEMENVCIDFATKKEKNLWSCILLFDASGC